MKKLLLHILNNFYIIVVLYFTSILLSAILFWYFEQKSFLDSLWWTFVTSLAIWYGDFVPETIEWRLVWVIFWHFWAFFIIPLIIANITSILIKDRDKFADKEQVWLMETVKKIAKKEKIKNISKKSK